MNLKTCLKFLGLTLTFSLGWSFTASAKPKKLTYKVAALSQAELRDSKFVQARIWSLRPEIKIKYRLLDELVFNGELEAFLETGSNDSLYIDEYRPRREIFINSGKFVYKPFDWISFDLGAKNQEQFNSPLFLTETAFAGVGQKLTFNIAGIKFNLEAQQTIANNQNLSARLNSVDEGTPRFYSESVSGQIQNNQFELYLSYSLFRFHNLSRAVAHQSRFLGNQVSGTTQDNANFLYTYEGHNTYARMQFRLMGISFHLSGHYLHNNKAPNALSDGLWLMSGIGFDNIFFFYEFFENESDSTPAFYNGKFYGHNNFTGDVFGFYFRTPKSEISFNLRYIRANTIRNSLYQDDFTGTQMSLAKDF